ncbi:hypothetical protein [Magnetospirillum sp. 64-120]|uniref:hypothetical protein n=1 Tax=Magnetospirillum sp. 64-120 TaxID=1895778 RepID=UPI000929B6CD|nr:hypothetical protein [Magnetospirillum sp. 64-120]OJX78537.1 MAG: hypothetical protein BGO92_01395 [Magnetospirillum sp. 64-120]
MKKRKAKAAALAPAELANNFTRGLVATGLVAAIQDRWTEGAQSNRKVLRLALQGGAALASGIATAESLRRGDYARAVLALAGGALGVVATEMLLNPPTRRPAEEVEVG